MLAWILEGHGMSCGVLGTIGYVVAGKSLPARVTTPESHQLARLMDMMRQSGDDCCVMELSSHALALKRSDQVRLDAAVFTNISQDHLDFHPDMGEYLRTKIHIFDLLKPSGTAVIGTYRPGSPSIEGAVTFGVGESDDYTVDQITVGPGKAEYRLSWDHTSRRVALPVSGRVNVFNSAGAVATALELGLDPDEIVSSLAMFPGIPGRLESVREGQDFEVIVDYAHTPDALERALQQAREMTGNRVLVVFGAGGDRDRKKRPIMGRIASESADVAVVTSDNPRTEDPKKIIEEILQGMTGHAELRVEADRRAAIRLALEEAVTGDVVLIAGKGHEDYQVLGTERVHFDDREEAREVLASLRGGAE
jgi:UDP-N-acetylmuramoyl-L-alanyl-D-glutamate--2,6-diaminopimelate ligase